MKYIVLVWVFVLSACGWASSQRISSPELTIPDNIFQHNVNIRLSEDGGLLGSGTYIEFGGKYWVLTANHVANADTIIMNRFACHKINWYMNNQEECLDITSAPIYTTSGFDIALIMLPGPIASAVPATVVTDYWWRLGESIYTSGWPNGNYALNQGIITGGDQASIIRTDTAYWFGISGGGVFNELGEFIGVAYEMEAGPTPVGIPEVVEGNKHFCLIPLELFSAVVYN